MCPSVSSAPAPALTRELADLAATEAFAAEVAGLLRRGDLLLLAGPFGAGKTAFARALLRALANDPDLEVPSPSFTLVQSYDTRLGPAHHFDLWRLEGPEALAELGWDAARADIVLAEWPERLGDAVPLEALVITFALLEGERRRATLTGWPGRLAALAQARPRGALLLMGGLSPSPAAPAPLLTLGGRSVLDQMLDRLAAAGVEEVVVEAQAPTEALARHVAAHERRPHARLRHAAEPPALSQLGPEPFFVVSGDSLWFDGPIPALSRLAAAWGDDVDAVLLLHRTAAVLGACGPGDFGLDPLGHPRPRGERELVPFVFAGVQLVSPALLTGMAAEPFGFAAAWRRALEAGRLRALVHDGLWFRLVTEADVAVAEAVLAARRTGWSR